MKNALKAIGWGILWSVLAGCAKKAPPEPSPPKPPELTEQQRRFQRVERELEFGGTVYTYLDIAGDDLKVAQVLQDTVRRLAPTVPALGKFSREDFVDIARMSGADDIKAVGMSSLPKGEGLFSNRTFIYTPQGRHGLMAVLGESVMPLQHVQMAPWDADYYAESDLNLMAAYQVMRDVVAKHRGNPAAAKLDLLLGKPNVQLGFSALEFIHALKGRITLIGRVDPERTDLYFGAEKWRFPETSILVRIDGVGLLAGEALKKSPEFTAQSKDGREYFRLRNRWPVDGLDFVMIVDGSILYLATSQSFFEECVNRTVGLNQNPEFASLLGLLGKNANGISYVSPHLIPKLKRLVELNPGAPEHARQTLTALFQQLPVMHFPAMTVHQNLPDGILIRSRQERSLKRELIAPALYSSIIMGAMTSFVISRQAATRASPRPINPQAFGSPAPPLFGPRKLPATTLLPAPASVVLNRRPVANLQVKPVYPLDLRFRGVESVVMVDFVVDKDGGVDRPRAVLTSDPALTASAVEAVSQWTFQPGLKDGRTVNTHMLVPIAYALAAQPPGKPSTELAVSAYYSGLRKKWSERAAQSTNHTVADFNLAPTVGLVWARIGTNEQGVVEVEQVGHGPTDPGAAELREVIRQSISPGELTPAMSEFIHKVGYVDIGLPSVASWLWAKRKKPAPEPNRNPLPP